MTTPGRVAIAWVPEAIGASRSMVFLVTTETDCACCLTALRVRTWLAKSPWVVAVPVAETVPALTAWAWPAVVRPRR